MNPIVFDRKPFVGKKCTGIISRKTFEKLDISREFIDREFKSIILHYENKKIQIRADLIRLNRYKLEQSLAQDLDVKLKTDAIVKNEKEVITNNNEKITADKVIIASGWKGRSKWVKAIEYLTEPVEMEDIHVFFNRNNVGGFSWIVPLPYGTLVGALGYDDPKKFIPKLDARVLDIHGGGIPRAHPTFIRNGIGDVLGLVKISTGGGIFSISEMLEGLKKIVYEDDERLYKEKFNQLKKEINRQLTLFNLVEKMWGTTLRSLFYILNERTINIDTEFDLHSLIPRRIFRPLPD
ncbi:NAD(P)/FAD-dependent oxidoreductase [Sulfolobus acidocaldarius]|uniref:NAD(P)/FAD-dependent oxidoreductase n=3 Tax=Sulfolobus acidocaldarius TaxID=2285 RepID=Q4J8K1_SULAC|nr:hypothetical protein [Sulfolobus acidocaldarius]AAY80880.1 hypothetical protein Saci_1567 [Sulfolobus acidocaldarius DSM 639]AGE73753.1 hypothetical protein SacRon12I_07610 [Sulfolobus acidocaldarius Ron12/I]ALU30287.1 hypothetical protein ATY89_10270 [Sulfolobus acidocaldarius]ALU31004.1 hypothetical protein ATZ20_01825 [Sulfolobus acidocaldarius]WCM35390.1 hypothetical protein GO597_08670 [Sulfolobus acidocaldarius DSM 639]